MNTSVVYTRIPDCNAALMGAAARFGVADLHEALGPRLGRPAIMCPAMKPLNAGLKIAGQAVTAENYPGDNLFLYTALDIITRGQILVMTNGGGTAGAQWGELAATYAQQIGVGGVVIDGPIRDTDALREMRFPIWSTSVSVSHPEKRGPGSTNAPIVVAGVRVEPGDFILADGDGVIVIPPQLLAEAVAGATARHDRELAFKQRMHAGENICDVCGLRPAMAAANITRLDRTWRDE